MKTTFSIILGTLILAGSALADDLAVTVYNSNLGVVSETRQLTFEKGAHELVFRDVPSAIDASSVRFEVLGVGDVTILEQNYAFDLVSPEQMYAKYVDQEIEMLDKEGHLYSGQLLAYSGGSVTLMEKSGKVKIISMHSILEVSFPALPEGLITRPTLFWKYLSSFSGSAKSQVSYQTSGMRWNAEYVGLLDGPEKQLDLSGWASIHNTSGKTYPDAKLKLIAGDIHRASTPAVPKSLRGSMDMLAGVPPGFEEKAFFEYHMYTLPRPATLANKEIKQISLFEPAATEVEKIYEYDPDSDPKSVNVKIKFVNSEAAGLGMPLPAGRVRLFKADDDGAMVLLGEDRIGHTPRDEEVTLRVGAAFDIVGESKVIKQTRISPKVDERTWEIELRNRKDEDITVKIKKRLWGYWTIVESSAEYTEKDANTIEVNLAVRAGETARWTVRVRFETR